MLSILIDDPFIEPSLHIVDISTPGNVFHRFNGSTLERAIVRPRKQEESRRSEIVSPWFHAGSISATGPDSLFPEQRFTQ